MQLVRNENVDIFVVLLEGSETGGVPADEKRGAQRVVTGGHGADIRDAAVAPFARGGLLLDFQGAIGGPGLGQQASRKLHANRDGDKKIGEQHRQQQAGNLQHAACTAPADALRVIKNWSAFFHERFSPAARREPRNLARLGPSPSTVFALLPALYCKMRLIDEANFLQSCCGTDCRSLPPAFFRLEVPSEFRGYGAVRTDRGELAATSRLRDECPRSSDARGHAHARLPGVFGADLRA